MSRILETGGGLRVESRNLRRDDVLVHCLEHTQEQVHRSGPERQRGEQSLATPNQGIRSNISLICFRAAGGRSGASNGVGQLPGYSNRISAT